jgi:threonine/homoserine/homoserine lactone efflux protein
MIFFLKGIVLGFLVAAPIGPIGILCINRTLRLSSLHGFLTGLGAATADGCYGLVAAFGLTAISSLLIGHQTLICLSGGIFLLYFGASLFVSRPSDFRAQDGSNSLLATYLSAFALTFTNPMTILSFTAAFATMGLVSNSSHGILSALTLVLGVFSGSAIWGLILSVVTGIFRQSMTAERMVWINRLSGSVILIFALTTVFSAFRS